MHPVTYFRAEYFGGPADGDKRTPRGSGEWWSADGQNIHHYARSSRGMEWCGRVDRVPPGRVATLLHIGAAR